MRRPGAVGQNSWRELGQDPAVWAAVLAALAIAWLCRHQVFFWDTVQLTGKQASYFYYFPGAFPLLPDAIDSGHPPGFGGYIALWWGVLGRSLWVSHLAMAPWLALLLYQLIDLSRRLAPGPAFAMALALLAADPVLLGQMTLASPDVALAALFLLAVRGILLEKNSYLAAAVLGLAFISLRGMMVGAALFLADVGFRCARRPPASWPNTALERVAYYLPGGLVGLAFLLFHYQAKGWNGAHPDSPWAASFAWVGLGGLVRNAAVYVWRLLDYGRVFVWLALGIAVWRHWPHRRKWWNDDTARLLLFLTGALLLVLSPTLIPRAGLLNHRYLLPLFLALGLLTAYALQTLPIRYEKQLMGLLAALGLLLGNLWVYPEGVAQGWDSTLAHLPYYRVRAEVHESIAQRGIPLERVGTAFPEIGPLDERDLSGRPDGMSRLDMERQRYVFYSNVMNDFTDEQIQELRQNWIPIFTAARGGVKGILYQKALHEKAQPGRNE